MRRLSEKEIKATQKRGFALWLKRDKPLKFRFEGRRYQGFEGDSLASALAAANVLVLSRSLKYRRKRGILSMAGSEANTLVNADGVANCFAERTELTDGLRAHAQQRLRFNPLYFLNWCSAFLPAGFYYRGFFKPQGIWLWWEKMFRRVAGLGKIKQTSISKHNKDSDKKYHDKAYGFCDLAIIGGGLAGITAAKEAARLRLKTILIEREAYLGGTQYGDKREILPELLHKELSQSAPSYLQIMTNAQANGIFPDLFIAVAQKRKQESKNERGGLTNAARLHKIRARRCIVATGAYELPAVFPNNDLPGIMLVSAAQKLMRRYGVLVGERPIIFTANQYGYRLALDFLALGVKPLILDTRRIPIVSDAITIRDKGILCFNNVRLLRAVGRGGVRGIYAIVAGFERFFPCDCLCLSVGFSPATELLIQGGSRVEYSDESACKRIETLGEGLDAIGSVAGIFNEDAVRKDAIRAVREAALAVGKKISRSKIATKASNKASSQRNLRDDAEQNLAHPFYPEQQDEIQQRIRRFMLVDSYQAKFYLARHRIAKFFREALAPSKAFVDFDEDLQVQDFSDSLRDGYQDMQLVKRYTTLGMGVSQGRHSNINGLRLVAKLSGEKPQELGFSTARPPVAEESFGLLAGRSFEPVRHTPMHERHMEAGAQMMLAGAWLRPAYYQKNNEGNPITSEALAVRNKVGIVDVTTLGGIDIFGKQVAEFVERLYSWSYEKQAIGRAKYLLMTDEAGVVADDGVCCRFEKNHMYLTTTTGGSDAVYRAMLFWKAKWEMDVEIVNVTGAFAAVNVAGPQSRELLEGLCEGFDLSAQEFPYMGVRRGLVAGCQARLLRVGFVGELGYEIHVPFANGEALWDILLEHGAKWNLRPFGVEAQRLLRLEKGHLIIGQDTDGLTIPHEADLAWAVSRKKEFFIGKRAIEIQVANGIKRRLVGFTLPKELRHKRLPKECNLVIHNGNIDGRVTSVAYSPTLDKIIGLAYVEKSKNSVSIRLDSGRLVLGEIVSLPFYDAEGARQKL